MVAHRLILLSLCAAACGGARPAASPRPDDQPLPLWSEVQKQTLPNGLTTYVLAHHKPENRTFLWLAVNVGSVVESSEQRGLAHFVEHMAFDGTTHFPPAAIRDYLEKIGMRRYDDVNAFTSLDQTVYELEVPTDDPAYLQTGLDILRDWAGEVTFDAGELEKERAVVSEEWRVHLGAASRLAEKQALVEFAGSQYANRRPIGSQEVIRRASRADLVRFYKDWYRPDLMAVIVVGDVDPAAVAHAIQARFANLANPANERPRPRVNVPPASGTRVSIETDPEASTSMIKIENLLPRRSSSSKADARRLLTELLATTILNQRLASVAHRVDVPYFSATSSIETLTREIDGCVRTARARKGGVLAALRALVQEIERMEQHGVSSFQLERARKIVARNLDENAMNAESRDSRSLARELARNFFQSEFVVGAIAERDLLRGILQAITIEDVNAVMRRFGGPKNRVITISGPESLPTRDEVLNEVRQVELANIVPWRDPPPPRPLLEQAPTPGTITTEHTNDKLGLTEWSLSNGARVIVMPTTYEADTVLLLGTAAGGTATVADADFAATRFAADSLRDAGIGGLRGTELYNALVGKEVELTASIQETRDVIRGRASVQDIETMFQLAYLRMTAPRKDEKSFQIWRELKRSQLVDAMREPDFELWRRSAEVLYKNHPRRNFAAPSDVDQLDLDKSLAFYRQRFSDAAAFTFVIVGKVDVRALRPLVERYLASLPATNRKETERDLDIPRLSGPVRARWTYGHEPKATVYLEFYGDGAWSWEREHDLATLRQVLSLRLHDVLREGKGGTYGVGVTAAFTRSPHQAHTIGIRFGCDPTRVDELMKATLDALDELQAHGVSADYLEKTKAILRRERETELKTNRFWLDWLANAYRYGDDPALVLDPASLATRVTPEVVQAAAKQYVDLKNYYSALVVPDGVSPSP